MSAMCRRCQSKFAALVKERNQISAQINEAMVHLLDVCERIDAALDEGHRRHTALDLNALVGKPDKA